MSKFDLKVLSSFRTGGNQDLLDKHYVHTSGKFIKGGTSGLAGRVGKHFQTHTFYKREQSKATAAKGGPALKACSTTLLLPGSSEMVIRDFFD